MKAVLLSLVLILWRTPGYSINPIVLEASHPLARFAILAYFSSGEADPQKKTIYAFEQIQRALFDRPRTVVASFTDYISKRRFTPALAGEYWSHVQMFGLVSPFNIEVKDSQVFEEILEFEVSESRRVLKVLESSSKPNDRTAHFIESIRSILESFQKGIDFRNRIEARTQFLRDIPFMSWIPEVGDRVVNPMVRGALYSETSLDALRAALRNQISAIVRDLERESAKSLAQQGRASIEGVETVIIGEWDTFSFLKPLRAINKKEVIGLVNDFFYSLPVDVRQDVVWFWVNHAHSSFLQRKSMNQHLMFLRDRHPRTLEIIDHFIQWALTRETQSKIQELTSLPVLEVGVSTARLLKENLVQIESKSKESTPLGTFIKRGLMGFKKAEFEFHLDSEPRPPERATEMSYLDFMDRYPMHSEFLKKKLAAVVLHNAFSGGLRTILSEDVKIVYSDQPGVFKVRLSPLGHLDSHPLDDLSRLMDSIVQLPLGDFKKLTVESMGAFLAEPENIRWTLQMHQLQTLVGADVLKSELRMYAFKNPRLVFEFFTKKWIEPKWNSFFDSKLNRCRLFYKHYEKVSH